MQFQIADYRLVPIELAQSAALASYQKRNRARLAPYSVARPDHYFEEAYWKQAKRRAAHDRKRDISFRWSLIAPDHSVLSHISMDQIFRGAYQSAVLGYSLDKTAEGCGLMTASLKCVIHVAFELMDLHRLAANHVPENVRSAAVLARLGFERDGLARSHLKLNGVWRDHVLNSLINPRHCQGDTARLSGQLNAQTPGTATQDSP